MSVPRAQLTDRVCPYRRATTRERMGALLEETAAKAAAALGASASTVVYPGFPSTINCATEAANARDIAVELVGEERVVEPTPTVASEDFAYMLNERPGAYLWLGTGGASNRTGDVMVHDPRYDFNDEMLPLGASYVDVITDFHVHLNADVIDKIECGSAINGRNFLLFDVRHTPGFGIHVGFGLTIWTAAKNYL